jgi:hypothetical protein
MGQGQVVLSRDRQIQMPHQGQDRVVALATMDLDQRYRYVYRTSAARAAESSFFFAASTFG